jgi:hypothetical protein
LSAVGLPGDVLRVAPDAAAGTVPVISAPSSTLAPSSV